VLHEEPSLQWSLEDANANDGFIFAQQKSEASNMKRRYKRLLETGNVSFKNYSKADTSEAIKSLGTMLEHHSKRWPNAYKAPSFHRRMLLAGLDSELLVFTELELNKKPIAWQISFHYKKAVSLYMPALDKDYIKYSPGNLCQAYVFGWSKQAGMKTVDHLRGDESYKSLWGGSETMIHDVVCNNKTLGSIVRVHTYQAMKKINNLIKGHK
jgi:CelD/BcsL family acetyltransferase involved in cellulose biosynthesis